MKRRRLFHRLARWLHEASMSYVLDRALGWSRWESFRRCLRPGAEKPYYPPKRRMP